MCVFVYPQVKKNYEALRQREEEERMVLSSPPRGGDGPQAVSKWEKESHEATRELLKVKDRLIEVERNVRQPSSHLAAQVNVLYVHISARRLTVCMCDLPRMPHCRLRRRL